jgi:diguanylate cyclase (GGDEF)-like protein
MQEQGNRKRAFWGHLSTEPAGPREFRFAIGITVLSALIFALALPFARTPLPQLPAFIPIYVTALLIFDLITAVLLFSQFKALQSIELAILAGGYLFTAAVTAAYALIFPGLFSASGLLASGPQTSSALYMFWHGGFPLAVIAYALLKAERPGLPVFSRARRSRASVTIVLTVVQVLALVAGFTVLVTAGHAHLPVFLQGDRTTVLGRAVLLGIWTLSLLALGVLWRRRPHAVLDVWLLVVMCVWLFDLALAAILNTGRYDLGWYVGRIYGLLAAGFLLIVLLSENARHYVRLVRLSAELSAANEELWQLSLQDGLTGLANRRAFDRYLAEQMAVSIRHKRSLALLLIDVDHFKSYNDRYGHHAGDQCLKHLAEALRGCCKRPADLAARYGGEEFALILPDTETIGAQHIAEAARAAISALLIPHEACSTGPHISVSIGLALIDPLHATTMEQLIVAADSALYAAKDGGRNRVAAGPVGSSAT